MSDTWWDLVHDKIAEDKEVRDMYRRDYCYKMCDEHCLSLPCEFCNEEEESWDYNECFEAKGWDDE